MTTSSPPLHFHLQPFNCMAHRELLLLAVLWWNTFILNSKSTSCVDLRWYILSLTLVLDVLFLRMNGDQASWMWH